MSFDWMEYVYLAEQLLNQTSESCFRCSINRAYYGVFCLARDAKGYQNISSGVHTIVVNAYKNSTDKNEGMIGITLENLKKQRIGADYHKDKCFAKKDAEKAVNRAKSILGRMGIQYSP